MGYWTYKIFSNEGNLLMESGDLDIEIEQEARRQAVSNMRSMLDDCGKANAPFTLILTVHGPVYKPMSVEEERYTDKEVREYGTGKDLSLGELKSIAKDNYSKGGDVVYECWDQRFYDEYVAHFGPVKRSETDSLFDGMRG